MSRTRLGRAGEGMSSTDQEFLWKLQAGAALLPTLVSVLQQGWGSQQPPPKGISRWLQGFRTTSSRCLLPPSLWVTHFLESGTMFASLLALQTCFPALLGRRSLPCLRRGLGTIHGWTPHSSEEWLLQAWRGHWGLSPHC